MIDITKSDEDVLMDVLKMLRRAEAFWSKQREEMVDADKFLHNTDNEGQWPQELIAQLEEEGRPVNTMNLLINKVQSVVGMCEENREQCLVVGVGDEDRALADFVNAILRKVNKEINRDELESEMFEHATVRGEHALALDVERSPKNPTWVKFILNSIDAIDVDWDPGTVQRTRMDSRYVFWSRWVSKDDFKAEYPKFADKVDELFSSRNSSMDFTNQFDSSALDLDDYAHRAFNLGFFVNQKTNELRIIRFECRRPVKKRFALVEGEHVPVDEGTAEAIESRRKENPYLPQIVSAWDEEVYWVEFVRSMVLYKGPSQTPFDGYSLIPQVFFMDTATSQAYGLIRHGRDPQQDVNKAFSQSLDHMMSAGKPGWVAEQGALLDKEAFEEDLQTGGSVAVVKDGAISGNQVKERLVTPFNEAVIQRLEQAIKLLDLVTGVVQTAESPSRAAEAATTTALREKRSLRAIIKPMRLFQHAQAMLTKKLVETIGRSMPVDQMLAYAGDPERWVVDETTGALMDTQRGVPLDLQSLRDVDVNLEFQSTPSSDLQRMNELGVLLQVAQLGQMPVEPEILASRLPLSRAEQEAFRKHIQEAAQAQAQTAQQQQQLATQQIMGEIERKMQEVQVKMAQVMETGRHNKQSEFSDFILGLLAILEKAEGTEKKMIMDAFKQLRGETQDVA